MLHFWVYQTFQIIASFSHLSRNLPLYVSCLTDNNANLWRPDFEPGLPFLSPPPWRHNIAHLDIEHLECSSHHLLCSLCQYGHVPLWEGHEFKLSEEDRPMPGLCYFCIVNLTFLFIYLFISQWLLPFYMVMRSVFKIKIHSVFQSRNNLVWYCDIPSSRQRVILLRWEVPCYTVGLLIYIKLLWGNSSLQNYIRQKHIKQK